MKFDIVIITCGAMLLIFTLLMLTLPEGTVRGFQCVNSHLTITDNGNVVVACDTWEKKK